MYLSRNSTALTVPNYTTELTASGSGSDSDDTAEMDYFGEDVRTSSMGSSNSQVSEVVLRGRREDRSGNSRGNSITASD